MEVARTGSFRGAAQALGTTAATVSRRISSLEEDLGVRLVDRGPRHLVLTEAGDAYLPAAQRACDAVREARATVLSLRDEPQGPLRLSAPPAMLQGLLGAVLLEYAERHPEVQLEVLGSEWQLQPADSGVTLAIAAPTDLLLGSRQPDHPGSTIQRTLGRIAMCIVASPDYLGRHGEPRSLDALSQRPSVILGADPMVRAFEVIDPQGQRQRVEVPMRLFTTSVRLCLNAARRGLGPAGLPVISCRRAVHRGELVPILTRYTLAPVRVVAHFPAGPVPRRLRLLLDLVAERLEPADPWSEA